jgi:hypothetical protein
MNPVAERVEIVAARSNVVNPPQPTNLLPQTEKYSYVALYTYPSRMFPDLHFVLGNRRFFGSIHGGKIRDSRRRAAHGGQITVVENEAVADKVIKLLSQPVQILPSVNVLVAAAIMPLAHVLLYVG